jgi:hypothetical protein
LQGIALSFEARAHLAVHDRGRLHSASALGYSVPSPRLRGEGYPLPAKAGRGSRANARNSGRFGDLSPFCLQIFEICVIMNSKKDKAAERTQLNEADMENRNAPAEAAVRRARGGATDLIRHFNRTGEQVDGSAIFRRIRPITH